MVLISMLASFPITIVSIDNALNEESCDFSIFVVTYISSTLHFQEQISDRNKMDSLYFNWIRLSILAFPCVKICSFASHWTPLFHMKITQNKF